MQVEGGQNGVETGGGRNGVETGDGWNGVETAEGRGEVDSQRVAVSQCEAATLPAHVSREQ